MLIFRNMYLFVGNNYVDICCCCDGVVHGELLWSWLVVAGCLVVVVGLVVLCYGECVWLMLWWCCVMFWLCEVKWWF